VTRRAPTPDLPFPDLEEGARYVGVALDVPVDRIFTYRVPPALTDRAQPGHRVTVPFRRRARVGFIVERQGQPSLTRVHDVKAIPDDTPLLDPGLLALGRFVARYYGATFGEALAAMVPRGVRTRGRGRMRTRVRLAPPPPPTSPPATEARTGPRARILRLLREHPEGFVLSELCARARVSASPVQTLARRGVVTLEKERSEEDALEVAVRETIARASPLPLTPDQAAALARLRPAVEAETYAPFLLMGVTGSGKTEVYLQAMETCVAQGRQAIVLVPEIALTPQTVRRFRARFDRVAVLHSAMTDAHRARVWQRIRKGEVDVVIGPRSAVFAPVPRLGLLVVDEEHEGSFKQQSAPRYHARDVGLVRAREAGAVVILGSATPALESWRHAKEGRYALLRLPERVGGKPLPSVQVVDARSGEERPRHRGHLTRTLLVRIREALRDEGQVILLQNRRGFATSVSCARCGYVLNCLHCDVALTYHRRDALALCHLCGHESVLPPACPDCALPGLRMRGAGTQTVESELAEAFPEARTARMDSDTMSTRESYEDVLGRFGRRELDILVGTQMIAKGLHFPHVTLVGIVSADTSLVLPDFRSAERTFSLVAQVSGRAGRGEAPGRVVVQTTMPDHPAIRFAAAHDFESFAEAECNDRKAHGYPPVGRLLHVVLRGADPEAVEARATDTGRRLREAAPARAEVLGPAVPGIARVQGLHRRHLLVKARRPAQIAALLGVLRAAPRPRGGVDESWDVDPLSLL
jgi:primosomal protein N' (replication factor Y)